LRALCLLPGHLFLASIKSFLAEIALREFPIDREKEQKKTAKLVRVDNGGGIDDSDFESREIRL
jgi:hypothetical protein